MSRRRGTRRISILLAIAWLSGCAAPRPPDPAPEGGPDAVIPGSYVYRCEGDFRFAVRVEGDSVAIRYDTLRATLPQVISASGARYSREGVTYWSKGVEALFETPAASYRECVGQPAGNPWEVARLLGYDFRAVGQEPGWLLEIDEGRAIHLAVDYGAEEMHGPAPMPEAGEAGERRYRSRPGGHDLRVVVEEDPCEDVMSGEAFPATVTVVLDGREYRGCGRPLTGETGVPLVGTEWALASIAGVPALAAPDGRLPGVRLEADGTGVAGDTGCNRLLGGYELEGDRLRFGEALATTRMACSDPALAEQERNLLDALARTRRYETWGSVLTLYDADGAVAARFRSGTEG